MTFFQQDLECLNLSTDFLISCNYAQAKAQVEQAYRRTDKSPVKTKAYQKLCELLNQIFYQETQALKHYNLIPLTYFSFSHQQDIIIKYEELIKNTSSSPSNLIPELEDNRNKLFLDIGKSLHQQKEQSKTLLKKAMADYEQQSFGQWMYHQYQCMIIRLFAKENLSDFEYKQALNTGRLKPILELYKYLWPIKWLVVFINCLLLPLQFLKDIPRRYVKFFLDRLKHFEKLQHTSLKDSFFKTLNVFTILLSYLISYFFLISAEIPYIFYLAPLVVYSDLLEMFANPINQFIRPMAQRLHISPFIVGLFAAPALLILFLSLPFFQAFEVLGIIYLASANYQSIKNISQFDLKYAYLCAILIPYVALQFVFQTLTNPFIIANMAIFWHFSEFTYQLMSQTFNPENCPYSKQLESMLPIHEYQHPPQAIQLSVNSHCPSQKLSWLFFNTNPPKEAFVEERYYLKPSF